MRHLSDSRVAPRRRTAFYLVHDSDKLANQKEAPAAASATHSGSVDRFSVGVVIYQIAQLIGTTKSGVQRTGHARQDDASLPTPGWSCK
jgi:hypothetical protein